MKSSHLIKQMIMVGMNDCYFYNVSNFVYYQSCGKNNISQNLAFGIHNSTKHVQIAIVLQFVHIYIMTDYITGQLYCIQ